MPTTEEQTRTVTFLPDPEPRPVRNLIISVDDHLVEPPNVFEGRMPAKFADRTPRVIEDADGTQAWVYEGERLPNFSVHATVGRPIEEAGFDPQRFDEMRRGCWDIHARVADMDLNGVYASMCFPSKLAGFGGYRFSMGDDRDFGLAALRAYNDWHLEEWAGAYPDRMIPCQAPWLADPSLGADEVRKNSERGFRAITFPDNPERLGLPSLHSGHWDPVLQACAETETVVCLHVGSASWIIGTSEDAPVDTKTILFPLNSMVAAVDWLYSMRPSMFPDLKIMLAESGAGWVPMLLDRMRFCVEDDHIGYSGAWSDGEASPGEVLLRNFWFSILDDPTAFALREKIGVENLLVESDYPHPDSTWPDTQNVIGDQLMGLPEDEVAAITHGNAAALFRHPLPTRDRT